VGEGVRACPDFAIYTLAFVLQREENQGKPQCRRRRSADPNATHLVDMAVAGDGLDCHAGFCRPYLSRQVTWSNLGQHKYLPSFRAMGFSTSAKCERKLAVRALLWTAERNTLILVYLTRSYVPRGTSSKAKALGL
jgi:hypothetical protein